MSTPDTDPLFTLACPWCEKLFDLAPFRVFGAVDWRQRDAPTFTLARGLQQMPALDISCPLCGELVCVALACYAVRQPRDLPLAGAVTLRDDLVGQRSLRAVDDPAYDADQRRTQAEDYIRAILATGRSPKPRELERARAIADGSATPDTRLGRYLETREQMAAAVAPSWHEGHPGLVLPSPASAEVCAGGCGQPVAQAGDRCMLCRRGGVPPTT